LENGRWLQAGNICKFVSEYAPRIIYEITYETNGYRITMMSDEMELEVTGNREKGRRAFKNKE
jgi:hypothetical protein